MNNFQLFNILSSYGDQYKLNLKDNYTKILNGLKIYDDKWSRYNPRKENNRWGLSVLNYDGKLGPGPDLDSIYQYNAENGVELFETDFTIPTPAYELVSKFCDPFKEWLCRTHFIKIKSGGFFPSHVDNIGFNIVNFRLLVPLSVCNPEDGFYFIYEDDRILRWKYGNLYFLNTCKRHTVFNANYDEHIVLIMNVRICKESIQKVTSMILN